ncbi:MAG TPA: hypothetical protein VIK80_04315 [Flavihumibacter sp.]
MRLILRYKLIMDDRRPNTFQQTQIKRKNSTINRATYGTMLMALLMGLLNLVSFAMGSDLLTHLTIYFSIFLFLLSSVLISDFTAVLIDARDTQIILPKPIDDRTFLMARLLHIGVHMCRVVFPLLIPGFIYLFTQYDGAVAAAFFGIALLATLFVIFLINAIYLVVIRITTPARFKSFIAWFQVGFMILLYGAYQIVPRPEVVEQFQNFDVANYPWIVACPPYWYAASVVGLTGSLSQVSGWWALAALLSSGLSCWVVLRFLAPAFNQRIAALSGGAGGGKQEAGDRIHEHRAMSGKNQFYPRTYSERLAGWLTRNAVERAGFLFTWKWALRNRGFRMRVYPAIGYIAVWFGISFYRKIMESGNGNLPTAVGLLGLIYLSCFIFISAIQQVGVGDDYKASWIFYSAPVSKPGDMILASYKALLAQFFLPLALLLVLLGIWWQDWMIFPNLLLGFCNQILISATLLLMLYKRLPASVPPNEAAGSSNFLRGLAMLFLNGGFGLIHYFVYSMPVVVLISAVLSSCLVWLLLRRIRNISWKELK